MNIVLTAGPRTAPTQSIQKTTTEKHNTSTGIVQTTHKHWKAFIIWDNWYKNNKDKGLNNVLSIYNDYMWLYVFLDVQ